MKSVPASRAAAEEMLITRPPWSRSRSISAWVRKNGPLTLSRNSPSNCSTVVVRIVM